MIILDLATNKWYQCRHRKFKVGKEIMITAKLPLTDNKYQNNIIYFTPIKKIGDGWLVISKDVNQLIKPYLDAVLKGETNNGNQT